MDQLSKFMITHFPGSGTAKVASAPIEIIEPNAFDKLAYARALGESCMDESFLSQFEGTPFAPQAVALAEQELAMEQRHLQARMARDAQMQNDNYMRESNEREGLRLQKMQLCIELHKMKAMGQGAPTPPGQAVIGEPQPGAPAELGMGADGGAPVQEPGANPAMGGKLASLIEDAARRGWSQTVKPMTEFARTVRPTKVAAVTDDEAQYLPEVLPFGSTYVGLRRGAKAGRPIEGAARGALGGSLGSMLGAVPGAALNVAGAHSNNPLLQMLGVPLQIGGSIVGGAQGTHMATRGMLPENQKQAALKGYAQRLRTGT